MDIFTSFEDQYRRERAEVAFLEEENDQLLKQIEVMFDRIYDLEQENIALRDRLMAFEPEYADMV